MNDALGWTMIAAVLVVGPVLLIAGGMWSASHRNVEEKYRASGGGLGGSFDAVWSPSAHEAGMERDRQTQRTAPAPSPGDRPDEIDDDGIRIAI